MVRFFSKMLLVVLTVAFVLTCGVANAADTVALVNSRRVMSQHPRFNDASRILILLSRPVEGPAPQMLLNETNQERRQLITNFSADITRFADMDRAIAAEQDPARREQLWTNRQNSLSEFETRLMGAIFEESSQAIRTVTARRGMTVAVEADAVFFGGTDITEEVIQQLNPNAGAEISIPQELIQEFRRRQ